MVRWLLRALALTMMVAVVAPVAATAATVEYRNTAPWGKYDAGEHTVAVQGGAEDDDIVLSVGAGRVTVSDTTAVLEAGFGCSAVDAHHVSCQVTSRRELRPRVRGGDGSDRLRVEGAGTVDVNGEAGDDVLLGGPGVEWLDGGAGADLVDGGAGDDHVLVDGREVRAGDTVDGGAGTDDFAVALTPGAWVDLAAGTAALAGVTVPVSGIENVSLGEGPATLLGDDGPNELRAGGSGSGSSMVDGRGGDDHVAGGWAYDHLAGGDGRDLIEFREGDVVDGGAGDDVLSGARDRFFPVPWLSCGEGVDVLSNSGNAIGPVDCERLRLPGIGTAPRPRVLAAAAVAVDFELDPGTDWRTICGVSAQLESANGFDLTRPVNRRLRNGSMRLRLRLPLTAASRGRARDGKLRTGVLAGRLALRCPARGRWTLLERSSAGAVLR